MTAAAGTAACACLIPGEAPGVAGATGAFERVVEALRAWIFAAGRTDRTEVVAFPPVMSRRTLERSGYLAGFPHLLGSVHGMEGETDVVLTPAACYPSYPHLTGTLPDGGRELTMFGWCYRHEATHEPGRLRSFRIQEFVRAAEPETCTRWRDAWVDRGEELLSRLGLGVRREIASDPFFGRGNRLLAADQRQRRLKWELQVVLRSDVELTAVASFNDHEDHFARPFEIALPDGGTAHTACVGFGLERLALALVRAHGDDPGGWPAAVREELAL
jgi:seryl-tRNA synthetase